MTVGILGSGFGLYGYLPAALSLGERVVMPARTRDTLLGRADVRPFDAQVEWVADDDAVLRRATTLVVGRRPADQVAIAAAARRIASVGRLLLEKPLAPGPDEALRLLAESREAGKTLRVGYTFRETPWAARLSRWLAGASPGAALDVTWRFLAHHYAGDVETWKRRPAEGGGALRFFGIQVIGLLAELGYDDAVRSRVTGEDAAARWEATFTRRGGWPCRVVVDSRDANTEFTVAGSDPGNPPFDLRVAEPFADVATDGALDRRVPLLSGILAALIAPAAETPPWYLASAALWRRAEDVGSIPEDTR